MVRDQRVTMAHIMKRSWLLGKVLVVGEGKGGGKGGAVQVGHDDLETGVFGTENVSFGDFDVVEFYVGCSGCCGVGGFDEFGFDVGVSFDEEDGVAFVGFAGCDEVVAEDAVGDPLLRKKEKKSQYG